MNLTITTNSGVPITQPTEKWLCALIVALSDCEPELFLKVCSLVDNRVDAFAVDPMSVQRALTRA